MGKRENTITTATEKAITTTTILYLPHTVN